MPTLMHYESSVLSTLTNRVLTSAIVIIDTDEAMGRRLDTLAAYAALVALAEIRNADAAPDGIDPDACSIPRPRRATSPPRTWASCEPSTASRSTARRCSIAASSCTGSPGR